MPHLLLHKPQGQYSTSTIQWHNTVAQYSSTIQYCKGTEQLSCGTEMVIEGMPVAQTAGGVPCAPLALVQGRDLDTQNRATG